MVWKKPGPPGAVRKRHNMERKRSVGVDKDDVLADFNGGLREFVKRYGVDVPYENYVSFNLSLILGCPDEETSRRIVEFYHADEFEHLVPMPGAKEAVFAH